MICTVFTLVALALDFTYADSNYPVPNPAVPKGKVCVIDFDRTANKDTPRATRGDKAWKVNADARYNYVPGWEVAELVTSLEYFNLAKGTTRRFAEQELKNESALALPGTYFARFMVVPPQDGEVLRCTIMIRVKKGAGDQITVETSEVSTVVTIK